MARAKSGFTKAAGEIRGSEKESTYAVGQGQRSRKIRNDKGLSQEYVAEQLGVTFQQVQKYEKGVNRMSSSRTEDMADALGVPVNDLLSEKHQLPKPVRALLLVWENLPATEQKKMEKTIAALAEKYGSQSGGKPGMKPELP